MNEIVTLKVDNIEYTAGYEVFDDTLIIYLPNETSHEVELRGLKPESTVKNHLRSFIKKSNA